MYNIYKYIVDIIFIINKKKLKLYDIGDLMF